MESEVKVEGWIGLAPFDHEVVKEINELWKELITRYSCEIQEKIQANCDVPYYFIVNIRQAFTKWTAAGMG